MLLTLERREQPDGTARIGPLSLAPSVGEDYWTYRVRLGAGQQAVLGFPKHTTLGIGFAVEDVSGNTNLPFTCTTLAICQHIALNKGSDEITDLEVIAAIAMIQHAATVDGWTDPDGNRRLSGRLLGAIPLDTVPLPTCTLCGAPIDDGGDCTRECDHTAAAQTAARGGIVLTARERSTLEMIARGGLGEVPEDVHQRLTEVGFIGGHGWPYATQDGLRWIAGDMWWSTLDQHQPATEVPLIIAPGAFDGQTPKTVPLRGPDGDLLGEATIQAVTVKDGAATATVDLPPAAAALIANDVTKLVRADGVTVITGLTVDSVSLPGGVCAPGGRRIPFAELPSADQATVREFETMLRKPPDDQ